MKKVVFTLQNWTEHLQDIFLSPHRWLSLLTYLLRWFHHFRISAAVMLFAKVLRNRTWDKNTQYAIIEEETRTRWWKSAHGQLGLLFWSDLKPSMGWHFFTTSSEMHYSPKFEVTEQSKIEYLRRFLYIY